MSQKGGYFLHLYLFHLWWIVYFKPDSFSSMLRPWNSLLGAQSDLYSKESKNNWKNNKILWNFMMVGKYRQIAMKLSQNWWCVCMNEAINPSINEPVTSLYKHALQPLWFFFCLFNSKICMFIEISWWEIQLFLCNRNYLDTNLLNVMNNICEKQKHAC